MSICESRSGKAIRGVIVYAHREQGRINWGAVVQGLYSFLKFIFNLKPHPFHIAFIFKFPTSLFLGLITNKDVNGGLRPFTLDLDISWRSAIYFTHRPLYLLVEVPGTQCIGGCVGSTAGSNITEKRKISCPCQASNPRCRLSGSQPDHHIAWSTQKELL
jgi:hypothetical protein